MEISELGEFGFIEHITRREKLDSPRNSNTVMGIGDDAAIISSKDSGESVISTDLLIEGVDFDLSYTPMLHLGYKSVVAAASDICAMGAKAQQITISLAITNRFSVEDIDEFYEGVDIALREYNIDLIGGDTTASHSGLIISLTTIGALSDKAIKRSGASKNEIICVSGSLGAAFMGQKLLEREKNVCDDSSRSAAELKNFNYLLEKALKPKLRNDILDTLKEHSLTPTSMIDISDGMASELLHICKSSKVGAKIYIDNLPIANKTFEAGEELGIDAIIAAMNGGDDYELMFTLDLSQHKKVEQMAGINEVGYTTDFEYGAKLITSQNSEITIDAQGHK